MELKMPSSIKQDDTVEKKGKSAVGSKRSKTSAIKEEKPPSKKQKNPEVKITIEKSKLVESQ